MLRFSLAARVSIIVIIALMVAWIVALGLVYRSHDRPGDSGHPSPDQVAALAALLEQAPAAQGSLVLNAVASPSVRARLANEPVRQGDEVDGVLTRTYAAALDGRAITVTPLPTSLAERTFPRLFSANNAFELRVGLRTGKTLVIESRSPLVVTRFGMPVGFGAGLLGTIVALVALLIMHRETRPLARLGAAVDRMDMTDTPRLIPQARTNAPEIRALINAFNRLQTRLGQLLQARMALLGGISHDVRTFATRLRLRVDSIPDPVERDKAIRDIADMIRLLDDALLASRAGVGELSEELVDLDEIVRSEVEDRHGAGAAIDCRIGEGAIGRAMLGDRVALRRIVANLADNALHYGKAAHLSLGVEGGVLRLTVDDEGSGIPVDSRELLLEPFVRLEASRNRGTGGAGLGLAIVRSLTEAQGGTITVGDAPGGGARFEVRLPLFVA